MFKIPCRKCGLLIDETDARCATCGSFQDGRSERPPIARATVRQRTRSAPPPQPVQIVSSKGRLVLKFRPRGLHGWARLGSLVGVVLGLVVALWLWTGNSNPDRQDETIGSSEQSKTERENPRPTSELEERDSERSVVQIRVFDGARECWRASGAVFPAAEFVVTNSHVVEPDDDCSPDSFEIWVAASGNTTLTYAHAAEVLDSDTPSDSAILRITDLGGNPASLLPVEAVSNPPIGTDLLVMGFPDIGGESLTVSKGIVSGFIELDGVPWVKTDAASSGGSSGGPALTIDRQLIGVVSQAGVSSGGDVVDCRIVADTNGDGSINERDSCVPVGTGVTLLVPISSIENLVDRAVE
jgi:S1-C subfamily serine protease